MSQVHKNCLSDSARRPNWMCELTERSLDKSRAARNLLIEGMASAAAGRGTALHVGRCYFISVDRES
jgi:hypothetical protein